MYLLRVYFSGFLNINKIFKYFKFAWLFFRSYKWRSFLFFGFHLLQSYGYNDVSKFKSVSLNRPNYLNNSTEPNQTAYNPKENTYSVNYSNFKNWGNLVGPVEIKVQLGVWRKDCLGAGILVIGVLRRHRVNQMVQAFCLVFFVKCWKTVRGM